MTETEKLFFEHCSTCLHVQEKLDEIKDLEFELTGVKRDVDLLTMRNERLKSQLESNLKELEELKSHSAAYYRDERDELREENTKLRDDIASYETKDRHNSMLINLLNARIEDTASNLRDTKSELTQAQKTIEFLEERNQRLTSLYCEQRESGNFTTAYFKLEILLKIAMRELIKAKALGFKTDVVNLDAVIKNILEAINVQNELLTEYQTLVRAL